MEQITLSDGKWIEIMTPRIETRFCFGYGYGADDFEEANRSARAAMSSEELFIASNMRDLDNMISLLDGEGRYACLTPGIYWFESHNGRSEMCAMNDYELLNKCYRYAPSGCCRALTEEEKAQIRAVILTMKGKFLKRLRAYLKRYGLSKVRAWSYSVDD